MKHIWIYPKHMHQQLISELSQQLSLPSYIIALLVKQGLTTPKAIHAFLHPTLDALKHDIELPASKNILDIDETCRIIKRAIRRHLKIQLYDDYDTDGITSATIMYTLIHHYLHYNNVSYYIPDRFKDGYGPNLAEYQRMYKQGMQLLITTDNGISGLHEIQWLKNHHVQVIITDHHGWPTDKAGHVIQSQVPNADAICMANCPYHKFHFDDFCGAGIAFMIACKMLNKIPTDLLDLACLGTVADSVHLQQENRVIVKYGLDIIHHDQRKGIRALAGEADVQLDKLTATDLSFSLIPRLNAIGRMDNANMAVKLLTTHDTHEALEIAQTIEGFNRERQKITQKTAQEAIQQAESPENLKRTTLVVWAKNWFPGIVGIVGSRLVEKFNKPTLVIGHLKSDPAGIYRGSGRSIPEFDLFKAMQPLQQHADATQNVMTSFGGHPMACGFSIKKQNLPRLSKALEQAGQKADLASVKPSVKPDLRLPLSDITMRTLNELKILEPFGVGNEAPLIDLRLPQIYNVKAIGKTRDHLSFTLGPSWKSIHMIAFNMGKLASQLENDPFDVELAGKLNLNHYKGHDYLQFMVQAVRKYTACPTRDELGLVYRYLRSHMTFSFTDYLSGLVKPLSVYLNLHSNQLSAILHIFSELQLCRLTTHHLVMASSPKNCKLSSSRTYRALAR